MLVSKLNKIIRYWTQMTGNRIYACTVNRKIAEQNFTSYLYFNTVLCLQDLLFQSLFHLNIISNLF